jgi:hypothetical protein
MNVAGELKLDTDGDGDGKTLGERIVAAARMAVAVHLFESLAGSTQHYGQQFGIGGAGPVAPATADRARARRPFRICGDDGERGRDASGAGSR